MLPDFEPRLRQFARVIAHVGLNLQRGQHLLIAEPYELQGVARSAEVIVQAIAAVTGARIETIWGDGPRLREFAARADWYAFSDLTAANAQKMESYVRNGDALLFLIGSQPNLMHGVRGEDAAEIRRIAAESFAPIAQQLMHGATNWTAAPAPGPAWAQAVYADLPSEQRLAALWTDVFTALRVDTPDPLAAWQQRLVELDRVRNELNLARHTGIRYQGNETDLHVTLPPDHQWCTAQLKTKFGIPFVANLPTEEIFTAPHKNSASGTLRVHRPVHHGGGTIEGITLKFAAGRVVEARADKGENLLISLLESDEGAAQLGEVAYVPGAATLSFSKRSFHHTLLDENASHHVALGEAYPFCSRIPNSRALNHSVLHLDLPLECRVIFGP